MKHCKHLAMVSGLVAMTLANGCGDDAPRRSIGATCEVAQECRSGLCGGNVCLDPVADDDGDGLINRVEVELATSPLVRDTDEDGIDDATEVGDINAPTDGDGDGAIDAVESALADQDSDCLNDQVDPHDVIANRASERRPEACGNGAYLGIGVCRLLEGAFRGTCAEPLGAGFGCFDPVGECRLRVDAKGATYTWDNGAVHDQDGLFASDGEHCVGFGRGLEANGQVFTQIDGGGVACPDGTEVPVDSDLFQAIAYCLQGADGCPSE